MNYHYQQNIIPSNRMSGSHNQEKTAKLYNYNSNFPESKQERGNSMNQNIVKNFYTDKNESSIYNTKNNNSNLAAKYDTKDFNYSNRRVSVPNNLVLNQNHTNDKYKDKNREEANDLLMKNNSGKNELNHSVTAFGGRLGGIHYSPKFTKSLNKPKSGYIQLNKNRHLDNLFNSFKNVSLNNQVNVNYNNTLESSNDYSHQLNKTTNKPLSSNLTKINANNGNEQVSKNNGNETIYNASAKCTQEYCYKEEKNEAYRNTMEDFCKIVDKYMGDNSKGLFCLYDGHGGGQVVKYVKDRMPDVLSKALNQTNHNVEKAFVFAFQKLDDDLKLKTELDNVGTTATVVYLFRENDIIFGSKRILYCANVGDSRAILISTNEVKTLTYDHKSSDDSEARRIRKTGGVVFNGRVFGQLALSRAIGDHAMKKFGVIPTPFILKHSISERDLFVVICSDGVWDVITESDIFQFSLNCNTAQELSDIIVKKAIDNGSRDNISCLTIKIN